MTEDERFEKLDREISVALEAIRLLNYRMFCKDIENDEKKKEEIGVLSDYGYESSFSYIGIGSKETLASIDFIYNQKKQITISDLKSLIFKEKGIVEGYYDKVNLNIVIQ